MTLSQWINRELEIMNAADFFGALADALSQLPGRRPSLANFRRYPLARR